MTELLNRRVLLAHRPVGALTDEDFTLDSAPVAAPGAGETLIRNLLLSIDPAARAWMSGPTYRDQLNLGEVVAGYTLSEVVGGDDSTLTPGTLVAGQGGWQDYAIVPTASLRRVVRRSALEDHLSVLGITGLTAWFGLRRVGRPVAGQTVLVSAAAGATGSVAGQLARNLGCRVVGIVGSAAKGELLTERLGFDAVVDHHEDDLRAALAAACPSGVDVYFDNVAGRVLTAALPLMNTHGVVVSCGSVSAYDGAQPASLRALPGLIVTRRLRVEGFLVHDYEDEWDIAEADLADALAAGRLVAVHDVRDGLDAAPGALVDLLAGGNVGKRMVRLARGAHE
jgi:NADPH-dependent curcumin reductase CurA